MSSILNRSKAISYEVILEILSYDYVVIAFYFNYSTQLNLYFNEPRIIIASLVLIIFEINGVKIFKQSETGFSQFIMRGIVFEIPIM